ncbi:hypothetical protein PAESOLCIP111_04891 [Paenibacillus solanacearum]|uniref:Uncharacterized protein n=1 Tax=Paenibacillus solanacearum TaxID=2048548 RepID=A0A916K5I7_9BACL|nr:hypothetical protein [Paenibacillus solanacearum]CAG7645155.1 hypothetical protein PAESOLCIP111_04891 [Paenibacillus solanacearum]
MGREQIKVPYGYQPEETKQGERGSLWVYDSFEQFTAQELAQLLELADKRAFAKIVFYPLHEETIRRMGKRLAVSPYYARAANLESMLEETGTDLDWVIDGFEGKRKKYTPMDTAFRYLDEKYESPHFVYVTGETAQLLAGYDTFEAWIKRLRLLIADGGRAADHPRLQQFASRWEHV